VTDPAQICEHGDVRAACIDCLEAPQPYTPKPRSEPTLRSRSGARPDRLSGTKDVSVPVYEIDPYLDPPDNHWLIAQGFPHDLRPGGFVYLRQSDALRARARVLRMAWWEGVDRRWRTGEGAEAGEHAGDGWVFVLDPDTWERVEFPLGELAENQRSGMRYLITSADGTEIRHLIAREPVPDGDWDTPPN
jgi:hypothetical protein